MMHTLEIGTISDGTMRVQDLLRALADTLEDLGITETPDGAPYSKTAIRAALRDL